MKSLIIGVCLIIGAIGVCAEEASNVYHNDKYRVNLEIPEKWQIIEKAGRQFVSFLKEEDDITSVNILAYYFPETVTVNGFQVRRRTSFYDGWQNLGERQGTDYEIAQANVDDLFMAIYAKKFLDESLNITKKIVAEYYYLYQDRGFVISLSTNQNLWKDVQEEFKVFIDNFWLGVGERPVAVKPQKMTAEWHMVGKDAANQFNIAVDIDPLVTKNVVWDFIPDYSSTTGKKLIFPIIAKDTLYFGYNERLYSIDTKDGAVNWSFKTSGAIKKSPLCYEDILYYFIGGETSYLYAILSQNGNILFKYPILSDTFSHPIIKDKKIIFLDEYTIRALKVDSGDLHWEHACSPRTDLYPVASEKMVIVPLEGNGVCALRLEDGYRAWARLCNGQLLFAPIINEDIAYLVLQGAETYVVQALDITTGRTLWQSVIEEEGVVSLTPPSLASNILFFIGNSDHKENSSLFLAIDSNTGEEVWRFNLPAKAVNKDHPLLLEIIRCIPYVLRKRRFYKEKSCF